MTLLDDPYLVLDYVDAAPQVTADDPVVLARAFAAELAAIHRIDGTGAAFADLPRRAERIAEHLVDPPAELDASVGEADIRETLRAHWPPVAAGARLAPPRRLLARQRPGGERRDRRGDRLGERVRR